MGGERRRDGRGERRGTTMLTSSLRQTEGAARPSERRRPPQERPEDQAPHVLQPGGRGARRGEDPPGALR